MTVQSATRRIHQEMDSDFQISIIKDRRIMDRTGGINQKEILQMGWIKPKNTRMTESSTPRGFRNAYTRAIDDVKRCHHFNSDQHLSRDCEQAKRNQNTQGTSPMFQKSRVNQIQVMPTEEVSEETETKVVMKCGLNLKPNRQETMP